MPFDQSPRENPLPIGRQRLLVLADFLETKVEPSRFDMRSWKCGTTACAAGWAAMIPEFVAAGYDCDAWGPAFREFVYADALGAFFGIEGRQITHLFSGMHNRTAQEEAAVIRAFVAKEQARKQELLETQSLGAVAAAS